MNLAKTEYKSIDLFKFIASTLVVALHTKPFASDADLDYYFTCFCRLAVPFFFIATSFFFFRKEKPDIKRYSKRLSILYLLWFLIELPIVYNRFFVLYDKPFAQQVLNFVRSLIFNNTWYASWFIMACILGVNIVYYLSKKIRDKKLLLIGIIAYLFSLSCSGYYGIVDSLLSKKMTGFHAIVSFIFMPANSFFVALIYVVLGKIVAEQVQNGNEKSPYIFSKKTHLAIIVMLLFIGAGEAYFIRWSALSTDAILVLPLITFFLFSWLLQTQLSLPTSICRLLRSMSILVYILHPIFQLLNHSLLKIDNGMLLYCLTLTESLMLAYLIVTMSKRVTILKWLY